MRTKTNEVPDGFILLQRENGQPCRAACMTGKFAGWLMCKHPDGQWVSERKLEAWEIMQAEDQRDEGIVHETGAAPVHVAAAPSGIRALCMLVAEAAHRNATGSKAMPTDQIRAIVDEVLAGAAAKSEQAPEHETIVQEGDILVCTACGTTASAAGVGSEQAKDFEPFSAAELDEWEATARVAPAYWYGTYQIVDGISDEKAVALIEACSPDSIISLIAQARAGVSQQAGVYAGELAQQGAAQATSASAGEVSEGPAMLAEIFNRMTQEQKLSVPQSVAGRLGEYMVRNGYRIVFGRWYLQEEAGRAAAKGAAGQEAAPLEAQAGAEKGGAA